MTLSSKSSLGVRGLYFVFFAATALVLGWYLYMQVPKVQAGETSVFSLMPLFIVVLVLLTGMVWALVGGQEDWVITDPHIRIRSKGMTAGRHPIIITRGKS